MWLLLTIFYPVQQLDLHILFIFLFLNEFWLEDIKWTRIDHI